MRTRLFSIYLCLLAVAQFIFYSFVVTDPFKYGSYLLYYNPRFGLLFLEETISANSAPSILSWASVIVLFCVGVVMFLKPTLKLYLIAESIMATPSIVFFFLILIFNANPNDGFSIRELPMPVLTFVLFSGPPLFGALLLRRRQKAKITG
jgi:hypothetical protein